MSSFGGHLAPTGYEGSPLQKVGAKYNRSLGQHLLVGWARGGPALPAPCQGVQRGLRGGGCTGGVGCEELSVGSPLPASAVHPQSGGGMREPHPRRPAARLWGAAGTPRPPPAGQASRAGRQGGQALPSQGIVAASPCRCLLPHSCGHARPPSLPDPHPVCRARHPGLSHPTASAGDGRPTIAHKGRMSPRSLPPARLRGNLPQEGRAPPDAGWPMSFVLLTLACSERHAAPGVPRGGQCHPPPCWARRRKRDVQSQGSG